MSTPEPAEITPTWIKARRKALGLNQRKLADAVGVSQGTVSSWETGRAAPSPELHPKLREALEDDQLPLPPASTAGGETSAAPSSAKDRPKRRSRKRKASAESGDATTAATASKAKATASKEDADLSALLAELWQAAVTMRGSIEPSDYKRYVLPIIFLRFLSLRYTRRRAALEAMVADPQNADYYEMDFVLDDPDEYRKAGVFIVPEGARWDHISKTLATRDTIKSDLDGVLKLLRDTYTDRLADLLPPTYAGSNMSPGDLTRLINLFSKPVFEQQHRGEDILGRVYEYFIGEFAASEGKRGGEYFTPVSIVRTLVEMIEPTAGTVYDPCCGSGSMFVQSDRFARHSRALSFYGQETKDFTRRLCRMNLFIHGFDGEIALGNTYFTPAHRGQAFDHILANPPFNDGSKGREGWGADDVPNKDARRFLGAVGAGKDALPLSARNANTMWMLHIAHHLADGGLAGFVMATGELSNNETARREVREALVRADLVDCIVQMPGQLFANTQIPCALWLLSKRRGGTKGERARKGRVLFVDARQMGALIAGSRKQKELADGEIARIAGVYRQFRREGEPEAEPGFVAVAGLAEIEKHRFALTPGRYVGAAIEEDDDEPFEERFPALKAKLLAQFEEAAKLEKRIRAGLERVDVG